jgi:hypothetical protein
MLMVTNIANQRRRRATTMTIYRKHELWFSPKTENWSGNWHCRNCKATGDKPYMENTDCKGNKNAN